MKLTIVTGGSKGLGAELVSWYENRRYQVIEFSRTGQTKNSIRLDLRESTNVSAVMKKTFENIQVDDVEEIVCFNNAGTLFPIGMTSNQSIDQILDNIKTNFTAGIVFITEVVKQIQSIKCTKSIINISSGAALKGYSGWSLYCAAKAGLENFIRAIALEQEIQKYPITAINVNPGVIDTDMQRMIRDADEVDFPQRQRFIDFKNTGALASPKDVAERIGMIVEGRIEGGKTYSI